MKQHKQKLYENPQTSSQLPQKQLPPTHIPLLAHNNQQPLKNNRE